MGGTEEEVGLRPGVVARGYKGSNRAPRLVQAAADAALVGDEPVLLARRTSVPVVGGRNRAAAARLLLDAGCDVIVSDDGLQHYALARDCEIVVVDAERKFGNGHLLPAGPLREGMNRLVQVDAVVVNGTAPGAQMPNAAPKPAFGMRLKAPAAVSLRGSEKRQLSEFAGRTVHAVAGIGNPQRFFNMLRAAGLEVKAPALPDHAVLHQSDIEFGDGLAVLMTEKDAVKCGAFAGSQHWCVPVSADFEPAEGRELLRVVTRRIVARGGLTEREGKHG